MPNDNCDINDPRNQTRLQYDNNPFNVGDRVIVIDDRGDHQSNIGDTGTVTNVDAHFTPIGIAVHLDKGKNIGMYWYRYAFINTEEETEDIDPVKLPASLPPFDEIMRDFR